MKINTKQVLNEVRQQCRQRGLSYFRIEPRETGANWMVQCPFHSNGREKKPSAGIRKSDGFLNCFSCGEKRPLEDWVAYVLDNDRWLDENFYEDIDKTIKESFQPLPMNRRKKKEKVKYVSEETLASYRRVSEKWKQPYHPYWKKRGITDTAIMELFDLGYNRSTRSVTFPVRDVSGNTLFVVERSVQSKFFHIPKGVKKPLYGLYELEQTKHENVGRHLIIVVESMIDCVLLWEYGYNAVALNGLGNSLQIQQLNQLDCVRICIATDNDKRGREAAERLGRSVKGKILTYINYPKNCKAKDFGEMKPYQLEGFLAWEGSILK